MNVLDESDFKSWFKQVGKKILEVEESRARKSRQIRSGKKYIPPPKPTSRGGGIKKNTKRKTKKNKRNTKKNKYKRKTKRK